MKKIEEKLNYYERQWNDHVTKFLKSNKRADRDALIVNRTRVETYKQILEILKENSNGQNDVRDNKAAISNDPTATTDKHLQACRQ